MTICHHPPGDPSSSQTISIAQAAVPAHLRHGDQLGECRSSILVEVYRSNVGAANCYDYDTNADLPADGATPTPAGAWDFSGQQPKGGFTTWVRAIHQSAALPQAWSDVTASVTWTVVDPNSTGTTIDQGTGRVITGAGTGVVHLVATLDGVSSAVSGGTLTVANATLTSLAINPGMNTDRENLQFGPDPLYIALGNTAPAKVTGTFTGPNPGGYCVTWNAAFSSNNTARAEVAFDGIVTTGPQTGTATVTARIGSLGDSIPVNVGPAEVVSVDLTPNPVELAASGNESAQMTATATYTDGSTFDVTYSSDTLWNMIDDDGGQLVVDQAGLVSANGPLSGGDQGQVGACFTSLAVTQDGGYVDNTVCGTADINVMP